MHLKLSENNNRIGATLQFSSFLLFGNLLYKIVYLFSNQWIQFSSKLNAAAFDSSLYELSNRLFSMIN